MRSTGSLLRATAGDRKATVRWEAPANPGGSPITGYRVTAWLDPDSQVTIDAAATDVQTAITQSTGNLPVDLPSPPTFSKTNPNDQPILYIALTSDSVTAGHVLRQAYASR